MMIIVKLVVMIIIIIIITFHVNSGTIKVLISIPYTGAFFFFKPGTTQLDPFLENFINLETL